jgi:hypothetical protein
VNQTAGNVEAETQKPQNQNYDKDSPEHNQSFPVLPAPSAGEPLEAPAMNSQSFTDY